MSSYVEITKYNIAKKEEEKKSVVNLWLDCTIIGSILIIGAPIHSLNQKGDSLKKEKKKKKEVIHL